MKLTMEQKDRAAGVLLGCAVGDALGVPFEFKPAQKFSTRDLPLGMPGGGPFNFGPGEFSDDTQMSLCIARVAYDGHDVSGGDGLDRVATAFLGWYRSGPRDVGGQVSAVLSGAAKLRHPAAGLTARAADRFRRAPGGSGGNGSLMRTSPIALRYLDDPEKMTAAARAVSALTHADPDTLNACVLWCHIIRAAVLTGDPHGGVADGLAALPEGDRARWSALLNEAAVRWPEDFPNNGWVVGAVQAAWSAVTLGLEEEGYENGITAAVGCGKDTDTVAAIAGAVLGATFGASGIRPDWRSEVHGWMGVNGADMIRIGTKIAKEA
jgi:ADP-ribosylglycohydrolase